MTPSQSLSRLSQVSVTGPTPPTQTSDPPVHCVAPKEHSPVSVPHCAPPPGFPLSVIPSQSLSRPSQVSAVGPTPPTQVRDPPVHCVAPNEHSPVSVPHCAPPPGLPLSITPSQSLSKPSQISVTGPTPPTQTNDPPVHCVAPKEHSPVSVPHCAPPPGFPLSVIPSQSLSRPSHVSAAGPTPPTQITDPPVHCVAPKEHSPVSVPHCAPPPGLPLSVIPSQSLSRPSQVSAVGPTPPTQVRDPPVHCVAPNEHSPVSVPHCAPPPGLPLSITPSQSLSR